MAGELKIIVTADTGQAVTGLKAVGSELQKDEQAFKSLAVVVNANDAAIQKTVKTLVGLKAQLDVNKQAQIGLKEAFKEGEITSAQYTANINRLVEAESRLKLESSTTAAALKSQLTNAGGAFSSITTGASNAFGIVRKLAYILPGVGIAGIIGFATEPIVAFVKSLFSADEAISDLVKEQQKFRDSLAEVESKGIATGLSLKGFVDIARDGKLPLAERNEALKEANKILGEHGEKLTLVNIGTAAVTAEIEKFTQATIQAALANKFADRAADLIIKQRDATKEFVKAKIAEGKAIRDANEANASTEEFSSGKGFAAQGFIDRAKRTQTVLVEVSNELHEVSAGLREAQLASTGLFGDIGFSKKGPEKIAKDVKTIADVLAELDREIAALNQRGLKLGTDEAENKIRRIESTINELTNKFKVAPDSTIINKLFGNINDLRLEEQLRKFREQVGRKVDIKLPVGLELKEATIRTDVDQITERAAAIFALKKFNVKINFNLSTAELQDQLKGITKVIADESKAIQDTVANIATAAASGIGEAIAGKGGIGDIFRGVFSALGSGVKQLGEYITRLAVLALLAKKAITNPITGIAAGIGLTILGSLIQAATSKNAFATGISNFGGGFATVGERGPERIFLPPGASVATNAQTNAMDMNGQHLQLEGTVRVNGQDLLIVFNRAQAQSSRNG